MKTIFALGISRQSQFWPVVNVRPLLGVRFIGQTVSSQAESNRLLNVRANVDLSRAALVAPKTYPLNAIPSAYRTLLVRGRGSNPSLLSQAEMQNLFPVPKAKWTAEETSLLTAAAAAPSGQEMEDAKLIDSFFGFYKYPLPVATRAGFGQVSKLGFLHLMACEGHSVGSGRFKVSAPPWTTSPFYCTGAAPIMPSYYKGTAQEYFGVDPAAKWQDIRRVVSNAAVLMRELASYPLPSPLSAAPQIWFGIARDKFREAANSSYYLDPQVARFLLTIIVMETYEPAGNSIMSYFKKKEKKKKRFNIIKAVALGLISIVFPAVAAAGLAAITTVLDVQQAKEASKDMIKASKQFAETDAEFSKELEHSAEIISYQGAQEAKMEAVTEEEAAAMQEPGDEGTITPEEAAMIPEDAGMPGKFPTTEVLVGGGIAAALASAFFLFR